MHVWCCDITYDVTVLFNDVTSENKMTHFGCTASEVHLPKIAQNSHKKMSNVATVHPECWVFHAMPYIYIYQARGSIVETGSGKIKCNYIGPLIKFKAVGPNQFLLMSLDGLIYPHLIEQLRLKAGNIWTMNGNVNNLADLRKALSTGLSIGAN